MRTEHVISLFCVMAGVGAAVQDPADTYFPGASSSPQNLTAVGDFLYFSADDGIHGRELWKLDLSGQCSMASDIEPGPGSSTPRQFCPARGFLLFAARTGTFGEEPYMYDPQRNEARMLKDIAPGPASSRPILAGLGNDVFYLITQPIDQRKLDLWVLDMNTLELRFVRALGYSAEIAMARLDDGRLIFADHNKLWITDGTPEGTVGIHSSPRTAASAQWITSLGDKVIFAASDDAHGTELWISDGTETGTTLVKDIYPGPEGSAIGQIFAHGAAAYFHADDGQHGLELWSTNGTAEGTTLVKDLWPGKSGSDPHYLLAVKDSVYFVASDHEHGKELWRTDGTNEGTYTIADLSTGTKSSAIWSLVKYRDRLFFCADSQEYGEEVFSTNGNPGDIAVLRDIVPGPGSSGPSNLVAFGTQMFFTCYDGTHGEELWVTDGSTDGTSLAVDLRRPSYEYVLSSLPQSLTPFQDKVVFEADDGTHGFEAWISNGSFEGTVLLTDAAPGPADADPLAFTAQGPYVFFTAENESYGRELWLSDGVGPNTRLVRDIKPGPLGSDPCDLTPAFGKLYFVADDGEHGSELWCSDGTQAGTTLVYDASPGRADTSIAKVFAFQSELYFYVSAPEGHASLWRLDEVTQEPQQVVGIVTQPVNLQATRKSSVKPAVLDLSSPAPLLLQALFPFGRVSLRNDRETLEGAIYFAAHTTQNGSELWKASGLLLDAQLVADLYPGRASSCPTNFVALANKLYFIAEDPQDGRVLWASDGTLKGTAVLRPAGNHMSPWPPIRAVGMTLLGTDKLVVAAPHPILGETGDVTLSVLTTSEGKEQLEVIEFRSSHVRKGAPHQLTSAGNLVFFTYDDGERGEELWVTDGTVAGTHLVRDILSGENVPP